MGEEASEGVMGRPIGTSTEGTAGDGVRRGQEAFRGQENQETWEERLGLDLEKMEDAEEVEQPIHDIVKAVQVALEGYNGQMAQRYPDAVLRGYTAMFPDGTKNLFLALYTATVEDINNMLDQYFGEDAVFLGLMDGHHVIRATPSSLVHDIVGLKHVKLGFGFGAETPDDGD